MIPSEIESNTISSSPNIYQTEKDKILNNFGGSNKDELVHILDSNRKNDPYASNSSNLLRQFISRTDRRLSNRLGTIPYYIKFSKDEINQNYKSRFKKDLLFIAPYALIGWLYTNKKIDDLTVPLYLSTAILLGIVESRAKRNVATINHALENIGRSAIRSAKSTYSQVSPSLTDKAKEDVEKITNAANNYALISKIFRYLSYVSGPVVSATARSYSIANNLSPDSEFNVRFAIIGPLMPLVNCTMSFLAADLRARSIDQDFGKFREISQTIFSEKSYSNPNEADLSIPLEYFKLQMQEPHYENKGWLSKDNGANPKKAVALLNFVGNRLIIWPTKYFPPLESFFTEDLTKDPRKESNPLPSTPSASNYTLPRFDETRHKIPNSTPHESSHNSRGRSMSVDTILSGKPRPSFTTLQSLSKDSLAKDAMSDQRQ